MLGDILKELRNKKNLYQQDLADILSVSKSTIAMWETNKREPDLLMLKKIANYFEVSIDYLLSDTIKFDFVPRELDDDHAMLVCPVCGYECTHFIRTLNVDFNSEKSRGIAIEFQCETDHHFYLVIETYKGNSYLAFADEHCNLNFEKPIPIETAPISAAELWGIDSERTKKYNTLDEYGKKAVDSILDIESKRCKVQKKPSFTFRKLSENKVSAGIGFDLNDPDQWKAIEVVDTSEARQADFAVEVEGRSMEPDYYDGDIVYIELTSEVPIGQVGLFIQNGKGYIKEAGNGCIISRNPEYDDISPADGDIECKGRVIGVAELAE